MRPCLATNMRDCEVFCRASPLKLYRGSPDAENPMKLPRLPRTGLVRMYVAANTAWVRSAYVCVCVCVYVLCVCRCVCVCARVSVRVRESMYVLPTTGNTEYKVAFCHCGRNTCLYL